MGIDSGGDGLISTTPVQRLILVVTLAQLPGDLRPPQFHPQIKGVSAVVVHAQLGIKLKRVGGAMKTVTVENINALPG